MKTIIVAAAFVLVAGTAAADSLVITVDPDLDTLTGTSSTTFTAGQFTGVDGSGLSFSVSGNLSSPATNSIIGASPFQDTTTLAGPNDLGLLDLNAGNFLPGVTINFGP